MAKDLLLNIFCPFFYIIRFRRCCPIKVNDGSSRALTFIGARPVYGSSIVNRRIARIDLNWECVFLVGIKTKIKRILVVLKMTSWCVVHAAVFSVCFVESNPDGSSKAAVTDRINVR